MDKAPFKWLTNDKGIAAALLLAVALTFANSFPGAFLFDDLVIARDNPLVHRIDLVAILRTDYWGTFANSDNYRPLTILSLGLNRLIFGPGALGFHLVNVALHAVATLLLFRVMRAWGAGLAAAGIGALLFAVHPLHLEVVNVVVGRSELLVAVLLLAAFLLACRKEVWSAPAVCACYLLALLAKEHAVAFLLLLPLWEAFAAGGARVLRERWRLYAALLAVTVLWQGWIAFGVVRTMPAYPLAEAAAPLAFVDTVTRVLTGLQIQWLYLAKMLVPHGLQGVYSTADMPAFIRSLLTPAGLLVTAATVAALLLLAYGWRRRSMAALFGVLYGIAFLPTSNLLIVIGVSMAERLTYFPSVWFCAGAGVLLAAVCEHTRLRYWGWVIVAVYAVGLAGVTLWRNPHYASEVRLWSYEVVQNPRDFLGWQNLADSLLAEGNVEDADLSYQWMLSFAPDFPGGLRGRTAFFLRQGRWAEALPTAHRVFELSRQQGDEIGTGFDGMDLAEAYRGLGECDRALGYLDGPSQIMRGQVSYSRLRGKVLACLGRDAEAVAELERIGEERLSPGTRQQLAASLFRLGRLAEARRHVEVAISSGADEQADLWSLLGEICLAQGDRPAAVMALERAIGLAPEEVRYREVLARVKGR